MRIKNVHPWDVSPKEALAIQKNLTTKIVTNTPLNPRRIKMIAGADVSYDKQTNRVYGAVAVLAFPGLNIIDNAVCALPARFPYVPGLLVFREGPALLEAFDKITTTPDVVMFDGHGIAHPRGIGIATHVGLLLDIPSIGVAKSVLVGDYDQPDIEAGSRTPLVKNGQLLGVALRTRKNVSPVFVSIGYKVNLESAINLVLQCLSKYRLPEPVRQAHILAGKARSNQL